MQRKVKSIRILLFVFLTSSILVIPYLAYSQKKQGSRFYDKEGRLIADTSFHITQKQLKIFLKIEDSIISCYMRNLKYPAQAHEFQIETTFLLSFLIDKKTEKLYEFKEIALTNNKGKGIQIFSDEVKRVKNICYPEYRFETQLQNKNNFYYLPFKFRINDNEEPKLEVENGYIFIQAKKKTLYEYSSDCYFGKPEIDTISQKPKQIPDFKKSKTKKKSPAKK